MAEPNLNKKETLCYAIKKLLLVKLHIYSRQLIHFQ